MSEKELTIDTKSNTDWSIKISARHSFLISIKRAALDACQHLRLEVYDMKRRPSGFPLYLRTSFSVKPKKGTSINIYDYRGDLEKLVEAIQNAPLIKVRD